MTKLTAHETVGGNTNRNTEPRVTTFIFRFRQVPFRTGTWVLDPRDNKIFGWIRICFVPRFHLRQICTISAGGSLHITLPGIKTVRTQFRAPLVREMDFCSGLNVAAVGWCVCVCVCVCVCGIYIYIYIYICGNNVHGTRTSHNAVIWTKGIPRLSTSKNVLMGI